MRIIVFTLVLLSSVSLFAQEPISKDKWTYDVGLGLLKTQFKSENVTNDKTLDHQSNLNPIIELTITRILNQNFGIFSGIKFNQFSDENISKGVFVSERSYKDLDNFNYHPYLEADYTKKNQISALSFPLGIRAMTGTPDKTRLILGAALQPTLIISQTQKKEGFYDTKGLYPDDQYSNLYYLLDNIPRLGYKHYILAEETELHAKNLMMNFNLQIGMSAPVAKGLELYVKAQLTSSMSDMIKKEFRELPYENLIKEKVDYTKTSYVGSGVSVGMIFR